MGMCGILERLPKRITMNDHNVVVWEVVTEIIDGGCCEGAFCCEFAAADVA
jgi:hypothetical protein